MKKIVVTFTLLTLCALSFAESRSAANQGQAAPIIDKKSALAAVVSSPLSTDCAFPFSTGSGFALLKYCVTANGNIVNFESPETIQLVSGSEGYGICDVSSHVAYSDDGFFGDTGNWSPATVVSHNTKSVKIVRTTLDNRWTLTQTVTLVSGPPASAKIDLALKNNSPGPQEAFLVRYADVDVVNTANNFDATADSAFAWNSFGGMGGQPFGFELQDQGTTRFEFTAFAQTTFRPPDPCSASFIPGLHASIDGSVAIFYDLPFSKPSTATVTVSYGRW